MVAVVSGAVVAVAIATLVLRKDFDTLGSLTKIERLSGANLKWLTAN
jgi:hypothetical protein